MAKENKTKAVILGMLSHESLSGYDIKKRIENSIEYFWDISYGQLYPELKKMEEMGLVTKQILENDNRPDKKVYTITESGLKYLSQWLRLSIDEEKIKFEILLKLFFGSHIKVEENVAIIEDFEKRTRLKLETLRGFEIELKKLLNKNPDHRYYLLTVRFGIHSYEAFLNWAQEAKAFLQENIGANQ